MGKLLMTASTWGHIRSFHLPYLRELQRRGWETHVACRGLPESPPYTDAGIELPLEKRMGAPANLRAARILRERVRREDYDLIVTHTALAAFFTRLGIKGLKNRPRLVNVVHGYLFDGDTPAGRRLLLLAAERLTARETDLLLTMNAWDEALARRCRLGASVEGIPGMGVDYSRLDQASPEAGVQLRRALGIPPEAFVLLYAAEFSPRKSQEVLLRAMTRLPERAVLILCGQGEKREECIALGKRLGLGNRVRFPGQVANMAAWYRMADAAVSASRSEGLPFNVMEAMHMGLPLALSRVKGHTDLVTEGETGLLYPYGDPAACAACIRRLMEEPELAGSLGERARRAAEPYALERVLPRVLRAYLEV